MQRRQAGALLKAGQPVEAAEHYRRAAAIWPSNASADFGLGMSLTAMGLNDEASRELRRAVELNPENGTALLELGRLQLAAGQSAEATETLKRAAALEGSSLPLGILALALNECDPARIASKVRREAAPTI